MFSLTPMQASSRFKILPESGLRFFFLLHFILRRIIPALDPAPTWTLNLCHYAPHVRCQGIKPASAWTPWHEIFRLHTLAFIFEFNGTYSYLWVQLQLHGSISLSITTQKPPLCDPSKFLLYVPQSNPLFRGPGDNRWQTIKV